MTESASECFERMAEAFRNATGMMAPGKDQPAEMGGPDYETRVKAWRDWLTTPEAARESK